MTAADTPRLLPIADLNQRSPDEFAQALRPLFETALPLAQVLRAGCPYASYADLLDRAESLASGLAPEEQVEVVNAHPRIGESAATVRQLSSLSYREQGYDREADLLPEDVQRTYAALAKLNRTYEEHFGFRFVVFVKGRPKSEIIEVLRARLQNPREAELQTALQDMFAIARDRYRQHLS